MNPLPAAQAAPQAAAPVLRVRAATSAPLGALWRLPPELHADLACRVSGKDAAALLSTCKFIAFRNVWRTVWRTPDFLAYRDWAMQQGKIRCGNDYLALARQEAGHAPGRHCRTRLAAIATSHHHQLIRLPALHAKTQKAALGHIRRHLGGMRSLTIETTVHHPPLLGRLQKLLQAPQAPPCILNLYIQPMQGEALGRLLLAAHSLVGARIEINGIGARNAHAEHGLRLALATHPALQQLCLNFPSFSNRSAALMLCALARNPVLTRFTAYEERASRQVPEWVLLLERSISLRQVDLYLEVCAQAEDEYDTLPAILGALEHNTKLESLNFLDWQVLGLDSLARFIDAIAPPSGLRLILPICAAARTRTMALALGRLIQKNRLQQLVLPDQAWIKHEPRALLLALLGKLSAPMHVILRVNGAPAHPERKRDLLELLAALQHFPEHLVFSLISWEGRSGWQSVSLHGAWQTGDWQQRYPRRWRGLLRQALVLPRD